MDKHVLFVYGSGWFVACLVFMYFLTPDWPRWSIFAIAALLGIGYAVADLMPWAMLGEVIDEGELLSGERREGVYNGIFTFLRKVGGASAFMVAGIALSLAGHSKGDVQPPAAIATLRVLATLVPAIFLMMAIAIARHYTLGRAQHAEILAELERKRASAPAD
jgi:Na+/melibiose symporter-like transporter